MPNRLARESSPYLRQHADQPVDWQPWDDEALARARAEQKPIFLSIGYSTCHWCHVMAAESFADERVAAILNRDFVAVKVDREERPDLDRVYMAYVQQTTGHGGWPMSVWLTPDLKPFYGGTYFAPDDRHGRPGFATVLETIARHWREQRPKIEQGAAEVLEVLRRHAAEGGARDGAEGGAEPLFERAGRAYEQACQYFHEHHDQTWGGFGGAPKFPRPAVLNLLFRASVLQGRESEFGRAAEAMALHTLQRMAEGGMHDHVGGGFHRYSVDERWHVPHFEKMLYDQAQIAGNCLAALQATGRPVFGWLARDIFTYVRRDLRAPGGAFCAAEDADSADPARPGGHAEGAFYVWSREELAEALGPRADFFCDHFGARAGGNVEHDPHGEFTGRNVLMQQHSLAQSALRAKLPLPDAESAMLECLERLRQRREQRPRPGRDGKVIAAWNGLMISALAQGAVVLGEPEWLAAATEAAGFIRRELFDERTADLRRSWCDGRASGLGFAEDYACLVQAALDLCEAGAGIGWLQWAVRLQARQDELFLDAEKGGYFSSRADDPTVVVRIKEDHDGAEPAATSISVMNLMRLDWLLSLPGARDRAVQAAESLHHQWGRAPHALPQLLCALELVLAEPRTAVIAGGPADPAAVVLRHVLHERARGRRVVAYADGGAGQEWLARYRPDLAGMLPVGGRPAVYLCDHHTCRPPITNPAELAAALG